MKLLATNIIRDAAAVLGCVALGYLLFTWQRRKGRVQKILTDAQTTLDNANREADAIRREARIAATEDAATLRRQTEESFRSQHAELAEAEKRLTRRETTVNTQLETLLQNENRLKEEREGLSRRAEEVDAQARELSRLTKLRREQLTHLARLTEAEAKTQILREIEQEAYQDASNLSRRIIEEAKAKADDKARQLISVAIQRYAGSHSSDISTATISLPGEEMKGRIIGRDGRNIRSFEAATGVTVLIDDTPNAVVLSGFDPVRREIARVALDGLVKDYTTTVKMSLFKNFS